MFSRELRRRGSWICVRCRGDFRHRRIDLDASHFFNRGRHASVRYDPRNVDPLCRDCHTGTDGWEYQKAGDYLSYMIKKLGWEGYERLRLDALASVKLDEAKSAFVDKLKGGTLWA